MIQPQIAITKNVNEALAIRDGLDLTAALGRIHANSVIVITPNWVQNQPPSTGTTVAPTASGRSSATSNNKTPPGLLSSPAPAPRLPNKRKNIRTFFRMFCPVKPINIKPDPPMNYIFSGRYNRLQSVAISGGILLNKSSSTYSFLIGWLFQSDAK